MDRSVEVDTIEDLTTLKAQRAARTGLVGCKTAETA